MDLEALEEAELVRLAGPERRPEAFEELMRRHHGRLFGAMARMLRDRDQVEDLCQEAFLRAWRGLEAFSGDAAFYTWLYRIARNLVASEFRRERSRPNPRLSLDQPLDDDGASLEVAAPDAADPAREAASTERRLAVARAIRDLPPDFREVVVLRDLDRRSYEEMAELLELPVGTVRSRLHRARMELKSRLGDFFDQDA
ncbi:MAG: sigma-70 family RNA polymerase sigma factor [Planctomycetes bacterium]|nr:sigma-70 family RNA polymerase sigma factor [Planctomycetota bacterium]